MRKLTLVALLGAATLALFSSNAAAGTAGSAMLRTPVSSQPPTYAAPPKAFFGTSVTFNYGNLPLYIPCFNCYLSPTITTPLPLAGSPVGYPIEILSQQESLGYLGAPTISFTIVQNGAVIDSGSTAFSSPFGFGYVGYAYFKTSAITTTGLVTAIVTASDPTLGTLYTQTATFVAF